MTDRQHNLATFRNMTTLWFPERRPRGKTYKFEQWQIDLANQVFNKEQK